MVGWTNDNINSLVASTLTASVDLQYYTIIIIASIHYKACTLYNYTQTANSDQIPRETHLL